MYVIAAHNRSLHVNRELKQKLFFYFLADGDLGYYGDAEAAYFKQKHRMVWERRHGKVGSGRKDVNNDKQGEH